VPWQVPNPTPPWPTAGPEAAAGVAPPPAAPGQGWPAAPAPGAPAAGYPQYGAPPVAPPAAPYGGGQGYPGQVIGPPPGPPVYDPHGVGHTVARLGSGAKRAGKVSFAVLGAVLEGEDVVEIVVQGKLRGVPGVAALVGSKLVFVNERSWKPDVVVLPLAATVQVQGWQDDRTATVLVADGDRQEVVERIPDRLLAVEFAQRVRDRVASLASQPPAE